MAIVRVHHPKLTKEEKEIRENHIKQALIEFYKETNEGEKRICSLKPGLQ